MLWEKRSAPRKPGALSVLPVYVGLKKSIPPVRPAPAPIPAPLPAHRKVLIVEDEPSVRNVLWLLLAALGFEGDAALRIHQALGMVSRDGFDAVLLDLRCSETAVEQAVDKIREIRPSLVGRVLVITVEVADRKTLESFERCALPLSSPRRVRMEEIRNRLRAILRSPRA